ncbi:solute carrier family 35 member F5 isoform X3 [Electrophorus electricus]|uniref:solute carrier family 35 member F5 isoform X3 n=1 Tax=Electrophorus electricus TaxID=8005 RepID=UPI0015D02181|nr:solute carrier family 35 member F5 isoform X3 [Electrophorus electricus]
MRTTRMSWGVCGTQKRRLVLGIVILLFVDIIWVASSELTAYVFVQQQYSKPFFSTFVKTSMFMLYLFGFLFWKPWRKQCSANHHQQHSILTSNFDSNVTASNAESSFNISLSEPLYVPVKFQDVPESSAARESKTPTTSLRIMGKLGVSSVAKISFFFCFVWFLANLAYQEALTDTQVAIVNILSSTSGLFTLILAAIFPSNSSDRFTLSKLLAVILSIVGVAVVSISGMDSPGGKGTIGSLWSLLGALLYAVYIVMLKRKVDREERLDIPMFFGFVGLFNLLLLWPGFVLLHYSGLEAFEMPSWLVISYIVINGLIGTVLSEFLWLWPVSPGCFLRERFLSSSPSSWRPSCATTITGTPPWWPCAESSPSSAASTGLTDSPRTASSVKVLSPCRAPPLTKKAFVPDQHVKRKKQRHTKRKQPITANSHWVQSNRLTSSSSPSRTPTILCRPSRPPSEPAHLSGQENGA